MILLISHVLPFLVPLSVQFVSSLLCNVKQWLLHGHTLSDLWGEPSANILEIGWQLYGSQSELMDVNIHTNILCCFFLGILYAILLYTFTTESDSNINCLYFKYLPPLVYAKMIKYHV